MHGKRAILDKLVLKQFEVDRLLGGLHPLKSMVLQLLSSFCHVLGVVVDVDSHIAWVRD